MSLHTVLKPLLCWVLCLQYGIVLAQIDPPIFEALANEMLPHYYHLHQHPELSLQERHTSAYLQNQLQDLGFTVTGPFAGYGFAGQMSNGAGPVLWIRADMDALPVNEATGASFSSTSTGTLADGTIVPIMHACGHDMHMASWLGTASFLSRNKDHWKGTVVFVAQPGEEFGDGARKMINDGLFEKFPIPDYVLALHVSATLEAGTIGYVSGYSYANVDDMNITVYGSGGHGAYPHTTIDPVLLASRIVVGLQTLVSRKFSPLEPLVITVGAIQGGTKGNIIPDQVRLQMTIRYHNQSLRPKIISEIQALTDGLAHSAGLTEEKYPKLEYYPENLPGVYNDPVLTEKLAAIWSEALGVEKVLKVSPSMGGEDFGRYGSTNHQIPISIFWLGTVDPVTMSSYQAGEVELPSLHSAKYLPFAEPSLVTGIKAMSVAAMGLLR